MILRQSTYLVFALFFACLSASGSSWMLVAPARPTSGGGFRRSAGGHHGSTLILAAKRYRESSGENDSPVRKPYGQKGNGKTSDLERPPAQKYQMRPTGGGGDLGVKPYKEAPTTARQAPSPSFTVPLSVIATETPLSDDFGRKQAKENNKKSKKPPKKSPLIPGDDDQPTKIPASAVTVDRSAILAAAAAAPPKTASSPKNDAPIPTKSDEEGRLPTKISPTAAKLDTTAVKSAVAAAPPKTVTSTDTIPATSGPPNDTRKENTSGIPASAAKIDMTAVASAAAAAPPKRAAAPLVSTVPIAKVAATTTATPKQLKAPNTTMKAKRSPLIPEENARPPISAKAAKADTTAFASAVAAAPPKVEPKISQRTTISVKGEPAPSLASAAKADISAITSASAAAPPKAATKTSPGIERGVYHDEATKQEVLSSKKSPLIPAEIVKGKISAKAAKANTAAIDSAVAAAPPKVEPKISQRTSLPTKDKQPTLPAKAGKVDTSVVDAAVAAAPPKAATKTSPGVEKRVLDEAAKHDVLPPKKSPLFPAATVKGTISAKAAKANTAAIDSAVAAAPPKVVPKISQRTFLPTKDKQPTLTAKAGKVDTSVVDAAVAAAPPKKESKISQRTPPPAKKQSSPTLLSAAKADTEAVASARASSPQCEATIRVGAKGNESPKSSTANKRSLEIPAVAVKIDTSAVLAAAAAAAPKSAAPAPKATVTPETSALLARANSGNVTRGYVSLIAMAQDMGSMSNDATALVHSGSTGKKSPDSGKAVRTKQHKKETKQDLASMVVMDSLSTNLDLQEPGTQDVGAGEGSGKGTSRMLEHSIDDEKLPLMPPDSQYLH